MRRLGNIKAFHNISTNYSKISIDGVTVNDLLSMIRTMMDKHGIEKWKLLIDDLYKHVVDLNNPHRFTIEQLDVDVIDVIYKQWIDEGYTGSKQEFIDIFFTYVKIADLEDMDLVIEGTSEEYVPVIAVLAEYVRLHDINLKAHEERFLSMFGRKEDFPDTRFVPAFAVTRMCNIGLKNFYDYTTDEIDLNEYPLKELEAVEGVFLFQLQVNESTGFIPLNDTHYHFKIKNVTPFETDTAARVFKLRINSKYLNVSVRTNNDPPIMIEDQFVHNLNDKILNLAVRLKRDNTIDVLYKDEIRTFGDSSESLQQLDSFISIPKLLSFPERITKKDFLTLGCTFFIGKYSNEQIKHLLTSYWPTPKE